MSRVGFICRSNGDEPLSMNMAREGDEGLGAARLAVGMRRYGIESRAGRVSQIKPMRQIAPSGQDH